MPGHKSQVRWSLVALGMNCLRYLFNHLRDVPAPSIRQRVRFLNRATLLSATATCDANPERFDLRPYPDTIALCQSQATFMAAAVWSRPPLVAYVLQYLDLIAQAQCCSISASFVPLQAMTAVIEASKLPHRLPSVGMGHGHRAAAPFGRAISEMPRSVFLGTSSEASALLLRFCS